MTTTSTSNSLVYRGGEGLANVDQSQAIAIAEKVLAENGNLVKLTAIERKIYYLSMCDRYGLDPWSSPFDYLEQKKDGAIDRVSLYPNIRAANFIAEKRNLSISIVSRKCDISGKESGKFGSYEVGWAEVEILVSDGRRSLTEIGCVEIGFRLKRGDAMKKAMTQARRRAVLAFAGLSDGGEQTIASDAYDPPSDLLPMPLKSAATPAPRLPADNFDYTPTYISQDQAKRFWTIANQNHWSKAAVSFLLRDLECVDDLGEVSSKFIQYSDYEAICDRLTDPTERDEYEGYLETELSPSEIA
jgi:hypothetical protein